VTWRRLVAAVGVGLYVAGLGFLGGMLTERLRFDQRRAEVLRALGAAERQVHARLMDLERSAR
jgi:hypothetical protein